DTARPRNNSAPRRRRHSSRGTTRPTSPGPPGGGRRRCSTTPAAGSRGGCITGAGLPAGDLSSPASYPGVNRKQAPASSASAHGPLPVSLAVSEEGVPLAERVAVFLGPLPVAGAGLVDDRLHAPVLLVGEVARVVTLPGEPGALLQQPGVLQRDR